MFEIYVCKMNLAEGQPYIISTAENVQNDTYLEGYILILKFDGNSEPIMFRIQDCVSNSVSFTSLPGLKESDLLNMQLEFSKIQFDNWLYKNAPKALPYIEKSHWEKLNKDSARLNLITLCGLNPKIREKLVLIKSDTLCGELKEFLKNVLSLKLKIERKFEDSQ